MGESEEDKKKAEGDSVKPPGWEDSHTAASLPAWWPTPAEPPPSEAEESGKPASAAPPAPAQLPVPTPPPTPPPAPPAMPAAPETQVGWQYSATADHLPSWWRPEQPVGPTPAAPTPPTPMP